jgi:hypothetical protein
VSAALPKVWACPLDTLTKSPGLVATAAPSSSTVGAFEDEERLRAVRVPVRGWPAPAWEKGALHEREIAVGLFRYRLERHHPASSREDNPLTGSVERRLLPGMSLVDPAHRPNESGGFRASLFL